MSCPYFRESAFRGSTVLAMDPLDRCLHVTQSVKHTSKIISIYMYAFIFRSAADLDVEKLQPSQT